MSARTISPQKGAELGSDDADNDDKMPQTGSAVIGVAVVALLLVAAGCGLVIARRR